VKDIHAKAEQQLANTRGPEKSIYRRDMHVELDTLNDEFKWPFKKIARWLFSPFFSSVSTPRDSSSFSHQLYFSGCSASAMYTRRLLCYITDLRQYACKRISVRVLFLFVFP